MDYFELTQRETDEIVLQHLKQAERDHANQVALLERAKAELAVADEATKTTAQDTVNNHERQIRAHEAAIKKLRGLKLKASS